MGIMQNLRKRDGRKSPAGAAEDAASKQLPDTPALMVMLPDASGIAAYQLNQFPSAKAAEFFIDSSLRGHVPGGSVMFWALTWQPVSDAATEPLVLIRDNDNADVVYPFSFADLKTASEFVQHEMTRGLHLWQVMIYWAVPARVEADFWGRSAIMPPEPPRDLAAAPAPTTDTTADSEAPQAPGAAEPHFLADTDIADIVREAEQAAAEPQAQLPDANGRIVPMPAPAPSARKSRSKKRAAEEAEPIDFPSASQKMHEARRARGVVIGWGNFSLAVDEALDVYVSRQVATKLAWNRLMRALGQAMDTSNKTAEARALDEEAARAEEARQKAAHAEEARQAAIRAEAAMTEEQRLEAARIAAVAARHMRKAWLNASWTLEEAAYAHAMEQRARCVRGWSFGTMGIVEAVAAQAKHRRALQQAWSNAGSALGEAHNTYISRLHMFQAAWGEGSAQIGAAVVIYQRNVRVSSGLSNFAIAIEEAVEAQAFKQEMIAAWDTAVVALIAAAGAKEYRDRAVEAWDNVAFALDGVSRAYTKKRKKAIRDWGRIARAIKLAMKAKQDQEAAIAAWTNITAVLAEAASASLRHAGLVEAWTAAGDVIAESAAVAAAYEEAIDASARAVAAIKSVMAARAREAFFVESWRAATVALSEATAALMARNAGLEAAWTLLTAALDDAARAIICGAWRNAGYAIAEAVPAYQFKQQSVAGWTAASIAIKQALVADAKLRITLAQLSKSQMTEVEKAMKFTVSRRKHNRSSSAGKNGRGKKAAAAEAAVDTSRAPQPMALDARLPEEFLPEEAPMVGELVAEETVLAEVTEAVVVTEEPVEENGGEELTLLETEFAEALLAAVDAHDPNAEEPTEDDESEEPGQNGAHEPLFPSLWRNTDASRWKPREEPFNGFESPPGRFHHSDGRKRGPRI